MDVVDLHSKIQVMNELLPHIKRFIFDQNANHVFYFFFFFFIFFFFLFINVFFFFFVNISGFKNALKKLNANI
jgi:hypothetical protein